MVTGKSWHQRGRISLSCISFLLMEDTERSWEHKTLLKESLGIPWLGQGGRLHSRKHAQITHAGDSKRTGRQFTQDFQLQRVESVLNEHLQPVQSLIWSKLWASIGTKHRLDQDIISDQEERNPWSRPSLSASSLSCYQRHLWIWIRVKVDSREKISWGKLIRSISYTRNNRIIDKLPLKKHLEVIQLFTLLT